MLTLVAVKMMPMNHAARSVIAEGQRGERAHEQRHDHADGATQRGRPTRVQHFAQFHFQSGHEHEEHHAQRRQISDLFLKQVRDC